MKKLSFTLVLILTAASSYSQREVIEIIGKLTDSKGAPLSGWKIENSMIIDATTISGTKGEFKIKAALNDFLNFSKGEVIGQAFQVDSKTIADRKFTHVITYSPAEDQKAKSASSALSNKSYWMGATIGYNLAGKSTEDVIGSAKIVLNPLDQEFLDADWGIIGNFANFQGNLDKDEIDKSVRKLTQSTQGLYLGVGGIWTAHENKKSEELISAFRISFSSGARLNSFTNVGMDSTTEDLLQFKNSIGFEFEGGKWKNGGKLTMAIEGSFSFFSKSQYSKIFSENKSILFVLEGTVVLPIASNMGLLFNSTITPKEKPAFLLGLLFKNNKN
jgi:hypothetical protein